jgi:hypothetical protein
MSLIYIYNFNSYKKNLNKILGEFWIHQKLIKNSRLVTDWDFWNQCKIKINRRIIDLIRIGVDGK